VREQHGAGRQPAQVGRALYTGRGVRCRAPAARGPGRAQRAERALTRQLARERGAGRLALRQPARQRGARGRHQLHHRADLRAPRRRRTHHRACQRPDADALWARLSPVACSRLPPCACPPACYVWRALTLADQTTRKSGPRLAPTEASGAHLAGERPCGGGLLCGRVRCLRLPRAMLSAESASLGPPRALGCVRGMGAHTGSAAPGAWASQAFLREPPHDADM